jgi:peptidoglycan biosynthesis protein MviN/MurJ (putative lipid II flippase)
MRRRINRLNGRDIVVTFVKVVAASAVMSGVAYGIFYALHGWLGGAGFLHKAAEALIPVGIGGLTFLGVAKLLRVSEIEKVYALFARKFGRVRS